MPTHPLSPEARERVRRAAAAARELDPEDRKILDLAYHGQNPDEETRRRLIANPLARDYAAAAVARWREMSGSADDPSGGQ